MMQPTFDKHGYPTEETIQAIQSWEIKDLEKDSEALLEFVRAAWHYEDSARNTRPGVWVFSTGGWSGNEMLLQALYKNRVWSILTWHSIKLSGGFLVVAVTEKAQRELDALEEFIVEWAWDSNKQNGD